MDLSKRMFELFVNRADAYAEQWSGGYVKKDELVTEDLIRRHLEGKITIGVYQLDKINMLRWICFDFDNPTDIELERKKAMALAVQLIADGFKSVVVEFSGSKGWHVWVFLEPVEAAKARYFFAPYATKFGAHELFPKQDSIKDNGFGNLVKIPLGVHRKSDKRSYIISEVSGQKIDDNFLMNIKPDKLPDVKIETQNLHLDKKKWANGEGTPIAPVAEKIAGLNQRGDELWGPHPVHGSETGANFWINLKKNRWFCFRHAVGGGTLSLIAVLEGIVKCEEVGDVQWKKPKKQLLTK